MPILQPGSFPGPKRTSPIVKMTSSSGRSISPSIYFTLLRGAMPPPESLYLQDAFRMLLIGFHGRLHAVQNVLVHDQLAVLANLNFKSVHRSRSGPFEIHPAFVITAPMTRALKFVLGRQPTGRAPKMGAFGKNRVDALFLANNPDAKFLNIFFAHLAKRIVAGKSSFES